MSAYLSIFLAGVVLASVGQVLMKIGAVRGQSRSLVRSLFHPYTLGGYALMMTSTVTSTLALRVLPLKMTVSLLPLGYVLVVLLSVLVLGEKLRRSQLWGMAIILVGILIFNHGRT